MRGLPPLDLHAHIDTDLPTKSLDELRAVVFAATRSLEEADRAMARNDAATVWGVGCHPGLIKAQTSFSASKFSLLLDRTALAGELGLDGKSRVSMAQQRETLRTALRVLIEKPRLVSLHSVAATRPLLDELEATPIKGAILHWWLGDPAETQRALRLGCFFSVNEACLRRMDILQRIPLERVLTETDHPFGNRHSRIRPRPGAVLDVEEGLAKMHGLTEAALREQVWRNFGALVKATGSSALLPRSVRSHLAATL
jgi:TatD DNase family protein